MPIFVFWKLKELETSTHLNGDQEENIHKKKKSEVSESISFFKVLHMNIHCLSERQNVETKIHLYEVKSPYSLCIYSILELQDSE